MTEKFHVSLRAPIWTILIFSTYSVTTYCRIPISFFVTKTTSFSWCDLSISTQMKNIRFVQRVRNITIQCSDIWIKRKYLDPSSEYE